MEDLVVRSRVPDRVHGVRDLSGGDGIQTWVGEPGKGRYPNADLCGAVRDRRSRHA